MTSAALITFVRSFDYDGASQLRPSQLSVVCNDRYLCRFFEFLVTHVSKGKNFVSNGELKRFDNLKADGRAVLEPEERRYWLEKKQAPADNQKADVRSEDVLTKEWSRKRLEAARARLQALRDLEDRLVKIGQHEMETRHGRLEAQTQLLSKRKADLKQCQIQAFGVDMKFRTASERLAKVLKRIKSFALDPSVLSALFLTAAGADKCISSVQESLIRRRSAHQTLKEVRSVAIDSPVGGTYLEQEIRFLRDGFFMAYLERSLEEAKLADVTARLERIHELERLGDDTVDEQELRSRTEDALSTAQTLKERINTYVDTTLIQTANMEADIQTAKVLGEEYSRARDQTNASLAREKWILTGLSHEIERLGALKLLLSEERCHFERTGLRPILRVQNLLCGRIGWIEQCKDRLETVLANKRKNNTSTMESKSQSVTSIMTEEFAFEDSDSRRAKTILDFIARFGQASALHRNITKGAPVLRERMESYAQRLESSEKTLLNSMKEYEAKKTC